MNDLFGVPIVDKKKKLGQAGGYAAFPGSGPDGQTCKTCAHSYNVRLRSGKSFWKCDLVRQTSGPGSDIRLKSLACWHWKAKEPEQPKAA